MCHDGPFPERQGCPCLSFLLLSYCVDHPPSRWKDTTKSWDTPNISLQDQVSVELWLVVVFGGGKLLSQLLTDIQDAHRWHHCCSLTRQRKWFTQGMEPQAEVSKADSSLDSVLYKHFLQDPSAGMWWYHPTRNLYKHLGQMVSIITNNAWMVYDFSCTVLQAHVL